MLPWFAVDYYGVTLGALALKPSDFCNGVPWTTKSYSSVAP